MSIMDRPARTVTDPDFGWPYRSTDPVGRPLSDVLAMLA
jgi:hypothetical protein